MATEQSNTTCAEPLADLRSAWDAALAHYDRTNLEFERLYDEVYAAEEQIPRQSERVNELRQVAKAYGDEHYFPARNELMKIPAPHQRALIIKLDLALTSLLDEHADSARADLFRLLGRKPS